MPLTLSSAARPAPPAPATAARSQPTGLPMGTSRRSIDTINSGSMDSTVDTDGKNHDAQHRRPGDDADIASNATLVNAVWTSPSGLAGFDSRTRDRIATTPGTRVIRNGWAMAPIARPVTARTAGREQAAPVGYHHARPERWFRLDRSHRLGEG